MSFNLVMKPVLDAFATKLTVYPKAADGAGHRENGRWIADPDPEPIEVEEPFLPLGRVSAYSLMLTTREVGDIQRYEAEWLSSGDYAIGTVVVHHGKRLVVRNIDDYTDYSDVTIYYLSADDEDNREEAASD